MAYYFHASDYQSDALKPVKTMITKCAFSLQGYNSTFRPFLQNWEVDYVSELYWRSDES
jgi:hypothetical protein